MVAESREKKKVFYRGDFDNEDRTEENENNTTNSEDHEDEVGVRPPRKLLTKKRLVHDNDSAIDENNHYDLHFLNGEGKWKTLTGYLGPKKDKNTKTITWTSHFPLQGRQRTCDVIPYSYYSLTFFDKARDIFFFVPIEDSFDLLFSDEMFDHLLVLYISVACKDSAIIKYQTFSARNLDHQFLE